jgi:hypothetical protein
MRRLARWSEQDRDFPAARYAAPKEESRRNFGADRSILVELNGQTNDGLGTIQISVRTDSVRFNG